MKIANENLVKIEMIEVNIARIVIQREKAMNALNYEVVAELKDAVEQLEESRDIACIILTGSEDNFVAGADIREMNGSSVTEAYNISIRMKALHSAIINSEKTYIAAIKGYCLGGGLELALACDIRLASYTAKLGLPETNLGIIPGGGGIQRLTELTGLSIASEMIMTGEIIDAEQAKQWQIVNSVNSDVEKRALTIAKNIASKSHNAIKASKELLNKRKLKQNILEIEEEIYQFALLFDHADAFEGMSAFIEKREPTFQRGG